MAIPWSKIALGSIIAAAAAAFVVASNDSVLARNIGITVYDDGQAMVQVPYRKDGPRGTVSVWIDDEAVIDELPAAPRRYWNNNYYFNMPDPIRRREVRVLVRYADSESIEVRVQPGRAASIAGTAAESEEPVAVARAMYMLAKAHWADDKLPADPLTAAAELKEDMRSGLVAGSNLWAMKKGLPIRTQEVATLDVLQAALASGGTAQVHLRGRIATLTGIVSTPDGLFIEAEYPNGPTGTTVDRIEPGMVRWGITHIWQ